MHPKTEVLKSVILPALICMKSYTARERARSARLPQVLKQGPTGCNHRAKLIDEYI